MRSSLFAAFALSVCAAACAAPAETDGQNDDGAEEGALLGFGESKIDVAMGRAVFVDGRLAAEIQQRGQKVVAGKSDSELGGGLVFMIGSDMEKLHYGIICTTRDATCIVRWLSRKGDAAETIAFGGDVARKLSTNFKDGVQGDVTALTCEKSDACTLEVRGLEAKAVSYEDVRADKSEVKRIAGF